MKTIRLLISILIFLIGSLSVSQNTREMRAANKKFDEAAFSEAREIYLKLERQGLRSMDLLRKLGDSFYFEGDLKNALEWYAELISSHSDFSADYLFRYSQSLKSMKLYKQSYDALRRFYYKKGYDPASIYNYLKIIEKQSNRVALLDFEYNSDDEDFAPQYGINDALVFSSGRAFKTMDKKKNKKKKGVDIYKLAEDSLIKITTYSKNKDTIVKENPTIKNEIYGMDFYRVKQNSLVKEEGINSKFQEASLVYSKGKDTVYFTRGRKGNSDKIRHYKTSSPKIHRAVLKNGKWQSIKKLCFRNPKFAEMHPALSPDGKKLYFAGEMEGTLGKLDLFVVHILANGKYSEPENLGDVINTLGTETFPFIAENGNLYFASNGHFGLGGLDVFVSEFKNGRFQEPYNLGEPINSTYDDTSFIINKNLEGGYFSSNRTEESNLGDLNIYKFKQIKKTITACENKIQGKIIEAISLNSVANCKIQLLNEDNEEIESTTTDEQGHYSFDLFCSNVYIIRVSKASFNTTEEILHVDKEFDKQINLNTTLTKGNGLVKVWLKKGEKLNDILGLSPIYFDSDTDEISSIAGQELQKVIAVLKNNQELKIHIKSFTDTKGETNYNTLLSQKRALSTKKYIVENGHINEERIMAEGFGSSNPIINCDSDCSESDHQINRRSEFIIVDDY